MSEAHRFEPLEQTAFQSVKHAAYLKGLLRPVKGKGELEDWANDCLDLRDDLVSLAQRRVLVQARRRPFNMLPLQLAQQSTCAGTTFLRWRNPDRSAMGVALREALVTRPETPAALVDNLLAMEEQRLILNVQISLLRTIGRQVGDCAAKMQRAQEVCGRRTAEHNAAAPSGTGTAR